MCLTIIWSLTSCNINLSSLPSSISIYPLSTYFSIFIYTSTISLSFTALTQHIAYLKNVLILGFCDNMLMCFLLPLWSFLSHLPLQTCPPLSCHLFNFSDVQNEILVFISSSMMLYLSVQSSASVVSLIINLTYTFSSSPDLVFNLYL